MSSVTATCTFVAKTTCLSNPTADEILEEEEKEGDEGKGGGGCQKSKDGRNLQ